MEQQGEKNEIQRWVESRGWGVRFEWRQENQQRSWKCNEFNLQEHKVHNRKRGRLLKWKTPHPRLYNVGWERWDTGRRRFRNCQGEKRKQGKSVIFVFWETHDFSLLCNGEKCIARLNKNSFSLPRGHPQDVKHIREAPARRKKQSYREVYWEAKEVRL